MAEYSPWGAVQTKQVFSPGFSMVGTAGHGGVRLDAKHRRALQAIPGFADAFAEKHNPTFGEETDKLMTWWEEDCDFTIPFLAFWSELPEVIRFKTGFRQEVEKILIDYHPEFAKCLLGREVNTEDSQVLRRKKFDADNVNRYVVICAWGGPKEVTINHKSRTVPSGEVWCLAKRAKDGDRRYVVVSSEDYRKRHEGGYVVPNNAFMYAYSEVSQ